MFPLNEILLAERHIVTQIVETEFVVRSEGDVASVCLAACIRVRFVFVNAIDAESVEHIERPHPLGVSFGEVVVDSDHMNSLS